MKTTCYKKTGNGIEKISNDFNKLESNSPETVLMDCYQHLFNLIDKGSNVLYFVKTSEYKESLKDILQDILIDLLQSKEYLDYQDNIKGLLDKRLSDRTKNNIRKEVTFDIFKQDFSDFVAEQTYGVTKQYLFEMLLEIKSLLTKSEYEIFKAYHVKGYSMEKIANNLKTYKVDISRQIKLIGDKIIGTNKRNGLCFKTLFDSRYIAYQSQGKKRQHKREVLTRKKVIELSGKAYNIDKSNYIPPIKESLLPLDFTKLPYTPKHGLKDILIDKSSYHVIANGNFVYNKVNVVIQNVYQNSCTIDMPITVYNSKEYRRKREVRKYYRTLKKFKVEKSFDLSLKHGRYLSYLTD